MNELQRRGAASQPTKYASLWTNRFFQGLWTQRSPLRDAASTRYEETFLGARGDALIDGLNTELTNRLTLARRPGLSVFNSADIGAVNSFYPFRYYNGTQEVIKVMADTASTVYDATTTNATVFAKTTGAGASTFKSIGNTLFWGDGVDQKKWLTSAPWSALTVYTTGQFIVDNNGNVQEVISPQGIWQVSTAYTVGQHIVDNNGNIQQVTTAGTSGTSQPSWAVTVGATTDDGTGTLVWTCLGDSGTSGATQPTWSTTYGSIVSDGSVKWMCMRNAVQNWGTAYPTAAPANQPSAYIGADCRYWAPNTSVTSGYTIMDANGNIELMTASIPIGGQTLSPTLTTNGVANGVLSDVPGASVIPQFINPSYATDGNTSTCASATCNSWIVENEIFGIWTFPSSGVAPPTITLNVLSSCTGLGWLILQYSTNSGATWTNFPTCPPTGVGGVPLDNIPRSMQVDTITISTGTVTTGDVQVQVLANSDGSDGHESVTVNVYEINMVCGETTGVSGGVLTTGSSFPKWNTTLYGATQDGAAYWVNCGPIGTWQAGTVYSGTGPTASIIDSNGNLQVIQSSGTSGSVEPLRAYPTLTLTAVANAIGGATAYTGTITGGASNGLVGLTFVVAGFTNAANNGSFICSASTSTTLTLANASGVAQTHAATATPSTSNSWATSPGATTKDNTVVWLNCSSGTVAAYSGWTYVYAYHCVDGHVSTASPASYSTGPVMGNIDVPLSGVGSTDLQVDAVWLFRTVDGGSTFLFMESIPNPGAGSWSLKDTNPDATLNLFLQAAIDDANDPPPVGSIAPEYHLGRVFVAVGNTVYYSQSYTSVGVAVQSFPPLNYFIFPSIVTRMVSTPSGLLVFTVSDVFVILGTGIDSVFFVTDFIDGVGLLHYHALAINGSTPMLLTSDGQFLAITTDGGVSELGFPIGDLLEKFNPATAYVSWHVSGSTDKAIYVSDGATGWYRCNPTATPETGLVWSPFAALTGGCSAVQSIEVSPGVHRLLVGGATAPAPILKRDLTVFADNGTAYESNAVIGSIVLAYPGQLAEVVFLTYDSPKIAGANLPSLGVILDEALPYYTGAFTTLNNIVNDPPLLPESASLSSKRAYMSQSQLPAWCRSMQIQVDFGADAHPEVLLSLTIFGGHQQEL